MQGLFEFLVMLVGLTNANPSVVVGLPQGICGGGVFLFTSSLFL
jgi:hypothetical protein